MEVKYYTQPFDNTGNSFYLGIRLNEILKSQKPFYNKIWIVASFAKLSGISKIKTAMKKSIKNNAVINVVLGTGKNLTTVEALSELNQLGCNVKIIRNTNGNSFDAKIYCFEAEGEKAEVFISSGNITEGGLYKNHELIVNVTYDLAGEDSLLYSQFMESLSIYFEPTGASACQFSQDIIDMLVQAGEIAFESDGKVKSKNSAVKTKTKIEDDIESDQHELLSIILPTGDSIELSLDDENVDIESKFESIVNTEKKPAKKASSKNQKKKKQEDENEDSQQSLDDIDIEIEESDRIEQFEHNNNSHQINEEFSEESYSEKNNMTNKKQETDVHIENYNVIDIEQMLYYQQQDNDVDNIENKHHTAISADDIEFIKSKETKRSTRKTKEKQVEKEPEPIKETVRKKFIISSITNKNGIGIINSFFIHINKLKGRGMTGEVRMPVAAREFSPEFWGWPSSYSIKLAEGKNKKKCKMWQVKCRVLDAQNPSNILIDTIDLFQEEGKSSFNFLSAMLATLEPDENDIIRILRCAENDECVFQCELIRSGSKEYEIWDQFCSHVIKGTGRRYGFA
ncbi:MAG: hypothetical protein ACM3UU_11830 [Ignavibacteriales bacterium]